ncbi:FtsX-like permease family protein [Herbivorax sp. ANBcel31]|nr:FtsX-like permease family protein [Herbivorax sp. ANBcel31]MDQ2086231.1 FtsX-like permease family protein [Herbivorax sp. ANBcel31]
MVSSALFFSSIAMSGSMIKIYEESMKQYFGDSDIIIRQNEKSPSPFFRTSGAQNHRDKFDYIIGALSGSASYRPNQAESLNFSLMGMDYDNMQKMNPFSIYKGADKESFEGYQIIISKATADDYNLSLGEYIDLEIMGNMYKFMIHSIAHPSGIFADDGSSNYALLPEESLGSIYNAQGRFNTVYLKLKNPENIEAALDILSGEYPQYTVREPFSTEEINDQIAPLTTTFMLMTLIVFIMSVFIIYSSFKVLTKERLPVIGTFRSIGATRKRTDFVLILESFSYGIIGGVSGCGLGIGILYIMSYLSKPAWMTGIGTQIEFSFSMLFTSFLVAVLIGFVSSIIPIIKVSKIPVKDIVLNSVEQKHKKKNWKFIFSILVFTLAIFLPPFIPQSLGSASMFIYTSCMILSIISIVLIVPYITNLIVFIFGKLYSWIFGNEGIIATKNLKDNKSIFNNISLLGIGISSLLMINIISFSVGIEVINAYSSMNFDIRVEKYNSNQNFHALLNTVEGVDSVYGTYELRNVEVYEKNTRLMSLCGIDTSRYLDFMNVHIEGNPKEVLDNLDSGRNILITNSLKDSMGVNKGDVIDLELSGEVKQYTITGFIDTILSNGSYAIVSERFLKTDANLNYYPFFYVKTNLSPHEVEKSIKERFPQSGIWTSTMIDMEERNEQSNSQMFSILKGFSILAMIIGIFGVLNNFVINFIERKHSFAVLRSVGMERGQIIKMLFIESLTGGIIGGLAGISAGSILIFNASYVLKVISLPIPLHYSFGIFLYSFLGGVFITLAASISPALKSSKLNIIEAIKYE